MTKKKNTPKKVVTKKQESYFDAERILEERKVSGKWQYLIKWSGHDKNGKPWSPDWQPKHNCTSMLLKEWEQEKLRQRKKQEKQEKQEQKNKENKEKSKESKEEVDVVRKDDPINLKDDKHNQEVQMDIDDNIINNYDDNLKQVLDKYCQNINEDIKRKSQSMGTSNIKKDTRSKSKSNSDNNRKIKACFPTSKVKLVKISPIQPIITSNSPIKSSISIVESESDNKASWNFDHKIINGKKLPLPSKSERISLFNLNHKRGLDCSNNNNNNPTSKRQKTENSVKESRILPSSNNIKTKKISSQYNKFSSDGNLSQIYNVSSSNQFGAIHVNSETIKALNSRSSNKNGSFTTSSSSSSNNPPKFRPIAAKITPSSQYNNNNNNYNGVSNVYSSGKWTSNNNNNSSTNRHSNNNRLVRSVDNNYPKNGISTNSNPSKTQNSDKNVSISSLQHKSYFHKSYVQPMSSATISASDNHHDNQTSNKKQSIISPNIADNISLNNEQHHSSNTGISSTMEHSFYQSPLEKPKQQTWTNEWVKTKSLNEILEKENHDLNKEKNRYAREVYQLRLEIERRPQSNSESSETIKKYQENISKLRNELLESQNKYSIKCKEYNQVKKEKRSEVETLKGNLNDTNQELKELIEENNRLKSEWSRIFRDGVVWMREDSQKISRLQDSLQELINKRCKINEEINKMRETIINQETDKMKESDYDDDYDQLIENLKLQNKLQEISLKMAEENSKAAEDSIKLILELKKLAVEEVLKKYDTPPTFSLQAFANLLTRGSSYFTASNNNHLKTSEKSSLHRDIRGGDIQKIPENAEIRNNFSNGNINTNPNILQARNVTTAPPIANLASNNNLGSKRAENPNASRNSMTMAKASTNSRRLSTSSINSSRIVQSRGTAPSLGVRTAITNAPMEMNFRLLPTFVNYEKKLDKAPTNSTPESPTKSIQRMNYFCEWNLCRKSFDDKSDLKKHLKEYHFNSTETEKDKTMDYSDDLAEVKIEV